MSTRYSIAQRTPLLNSLFAGVACAISLTLTAGPALAAPGDLERVEISGRVYEAPARFDIKANCDQVEEQLQDALQMTWANERRTGEVKVELVMDGSDITAVKARGISHVIERSVRRAVRGLHCGAQKTAGAQIYRFRVDFIDPDAQSYSGETQTASARSGLRLALANE